MPKQLICSKITIFPHPATTFGFFHYLQLTFLKLDLRPTRSFTLGFASYFQRNSFHFQSFVARCSGGIKRPSLSSKPPLSALQPLLGIVSSCATLTHWLLVYDETFCFVYLHPLITPSCNNKRSDHVWSFAIYCYDTLFDPILLGFKLKAYIK